MNLFSINVAAGYFSEKENLLVDSINFNMLYKQEVFDLIISFAAKIKYNDEQQNFYDDQARCYFQRTHRCDFENDQ